ncbi:MAG: ATP-binding cassette domain-containing protein [Deltaproteobacteria bacterium]|nr:ATP-binding cassette domain-containing protein [Deltaproteobacteria bacterium]
MTPLPSPPGAPDNVLIRLEGVHKRFGELVVLNGVDMDIRRGETTVILGPSGAGKSVLIKHIVGLIAPDAGRVWVGDVDMARARGAALLGVRKRMGMLFQDGALFDSLSVAENIAFPLRHHTRLSEAEIRRVVEEKLELVELPGLGGRAVSELSGGQRKRVGLARAIAMEPEVVVFDEPNSGLDPLTSGTIDELILRMKERLGVSFVVITHDIVSAVQIADRIGMLWRGDLLEYGPIADFLHTREEVVRRFLARNVDLAPLEAL